jgi:hypothetical protein
LKPAHVMGEARGGGPVGFSDAVPSCGQITHEQSARETTTVRAQGGIDVADDASHREALGTPAVHMCLNAVLMCWDAWDCAHVCGWVGAARNMLTVSAGSPNLLLRLTEFAFEGRGPAPSKTDQARSNSSKFPPACLRPGLTPKVSPTNSVGRLFEAVCIECTISIEFTPC